MKAMIKKLILLVFLPNIIQLDATWTVINSIEPAMVKATIRTDLWEITTETTIRARLAVLENSTVILSCKALFPVTWYYLDTTKNHLYEYLDQKNQTFEPVEFLKSEYYNSTGYKGLDKDYFVSPFEAYETNITLQNVRTGDQTYFCGYRNDYRLDDRSVYVYIDLRNGTSDEYQFLQSGFDVITPPCGSLISGSSDKFHISLIHSEPAHVKTNYSLMTSKRLLRRLMDSRQSSPWLMGSWQSDDGFMAENKHVSLKTVTLSPTIRRIILTFDCSVLLKNLNYDVKIPYYTLTAESDFGKGEIKKIRETCWITNPVTTRFRQRTQVPSADEGRNTGLIFSKKDFFVLSFKAPVLPESKPILILISELEPYENGRSCQKKYLAYRDTQERCGILGITGIQAETEINIQIAAQAKRPCHIRLLFDFRTAAFWFHQSNIFYEFFVLLSSKSSLSKNQNGIMNTANDNEAVMYSGEKFLFRTVWPVCYPYLIGWCYDASQIDRTRSTCAFFFDNSTEEYDQHYNTMAEDKWIKLKSAYNKNKFSITYRLRFIRLQTNHTGIYYVSFLKKIPRKVVFRSGSAQRFFLTVENPVEPFFKDHKRNITEKVTRFKKDTNATTLFCNADGNPKPNISWAVETDNKGLLLAKSITIDNSNEFLNVFRSGTCTCHAENKFGSNFRRFIVEEIEDPPNVLPIALGLGLPAGILLLGILLSAIYWLNRKVKIKASLRKLKRELQNPTSHEGIAVNVALNEQTENIPYSQTYFEIDPSSFTVTGTCLGVGEFGKVFKAELKSQNGFINVAIKIPINASNVESFTALVAELKIMGYIRPHPNVLQLIGACTNDLEKGQLFVLTELCENGSLKTYLAKNVSKFEGFDVDFATGQYIGAPGAVESLIKYAYQTVNGMEHLAAANIIHRDLALRNLLLTHNHIVKISDFGMSRQKLIYESPLSKYAALPLRWMAIESLLNGEYTQKTDVWSFGIILWEMFCCGTAIPYPHHVDQFKIRAWLRQSEDNRMGPPLIACDEIYQLMRACWKSDPNDRPSFSSCKGTISSILEQKSPAQHQALLNDLSDCLSSIFRREFCKNGNAQTDITQDSASHINEDSDENVNINPRSGGDNEAAQVQSMELQLISEASTTVFPNNVCNTQNVKIIDDYSKNRFPDSADSSSE